MKTIFYLLRYLFVFVEKTTPNYNTIYPIFEFLHYVTVLCGYTKMPTFYIFHTKRIFEVK